MRFGEWDGSYTYSLRMAPTIDGSYAYSLRMAPTIDGSYAYSLRMAPTIDNSYTYSLRIAPTIDGSYTYSLRMAPTIDGSYTYSLRMAPTIGYYRHKIPHTPMEKVEIRPLFVRGCYEYCTHNSYVSFWSNSFQINAFYVMHLFFREKSVIFLEFEFSCWGIGFFWTIFPIHLSSSMNILW